MYVNVMNIVCIIIILVNLQNIYIYISDMQTGFLFLFETLKSQGL